MNCNNDITSHKSMYSDDMQAQTIQKQKYTSGLDLPEHVQTCPDIRSSYIIIQSDSMIQRKRQDMFKIGQSRKYCC